ncbi:hypothetical protein Tco_0609956 [Tanacetum coccineum]
MILLLLSVSIPPVTENFIIPCVVNGTACIFRNPGLPMVPLYGDVDLTIMKSIHVDVKCSPSPIFYQKCSARRVSQRMTLHRRTCGALGGLRSPLLLSGDLPLLHPLLKTGMKFRDWVRSFGISFASLSFAMTGSLESLELPGFEHILNLSS